MQRHREHISLGRSALYCASFALHGMAFGFCEFVMPAINKGASARTGSTILYIRYESATSMRVALNLLNKLPLAAGKPVVSLLNSAERYLQAFEKGVREDLLEFECSAYVLGDLTNTPECPETAVNPSHSDAPVVIRDALKSGTLTKETTKCEISGEIDSCLEGHDQEAEREDIYDFSPKLSRERPNGRYKNTLIGKIDAVQGVEPYLKENKQPVSDHADISTEKGTLKS
ncbi:hypothetical protein DSO57_1022484 [Entomophthora muscae]|uniref:Uncharacterized protein n=1 Tax=Entomophthora muscae TaxID=34485 RepID=A0ACC2TDY2_9FUNG|nr:hypothetical protein DSO57_1022484 [Entomophthora muscae]